MVLIGFGMIEWPGKLCWPKYEIELLIGLGHRLFQNIL